MDHGLRLGVETMDAMHAEFLELLERIRGCDAGSFMPLFSEIIAHTQEHFATEEALMEAQGYYGLQEHRGEHENLLNEMRYFYEKAKRIPAFGRSYINDYAFEKFRRHIINIDSQLAMFLKEAKH